MATATAPRERREVTEIVELDNGRRRYDFAWTIPGRDIAGEGYAFERASVPDAILEDRWEGLMSTATGDFTKLNLRLDDVLGDLAKGVVRNGWDSESGRDSYVMTEEGIIGVWETVDLEGLRNFIHAWIIERARKVAR